MSAKRLTILLGLCLVLAPEQAWAQSAQDLARIEKEMAARKEAATRLEQEAKRQEAEIEDLRRKLIDATSSLQSSQEEKDKLEDKLHALESESVVRAQALQTSQTRLAQVTSDLVRLMREPPVLLTMREENASEHVRRSVLVRELLPLLKAEADKLSGEMDYFDDLGRRAAEQRSLMAAASQNLQWQRHNLDQLVEARQGKLRKTKEEREAIKSQLEQLAKEAKTLKQLLEKVTESSWDKKIARRDPIPSLRAGLLNPVSGRVLRRFGQKDEFGVASEGVTYATDSGVPVVAPQSGRVVFLGPFQGYGKVLILQHQGGAHSFLAGFERINAEVGQSVAAGEPLGIVAAPDAGRAELYFEWRVDKKPVDPFLKGLSAKGG